MFSHIFIDKKVYFILMSLLVLSYLYHFYGVAYLFFISLPNIVYIM